jgi:hypothetical protein
MDTSATSMLLNEQLKAFFCPCAHARNADVEIVPLPSLALAQAPSEVITPMSYSHITKS